MLKLYIKLPNDTFDALLKVSELEKRNVDQQAVFIIEADLTRRGLLPVDSAKPAVSTETPLPGKSA